MPRFQRVALFVALTVFEQQLSTSEVCSPSFKEDTMRQSEYELVHSEGGEKKEKLNQAFKIKRKTQRPCFQTSWISLWI